MLAGRSNRFRIDRGHCLPSQFRQFRPEHQEHLRSKELPNSSEWKASDVLAAVGTPLMSLAGLLAIVVGSWLHSTSVTIAFSCASSLLGLLWLCTFWTLVASPLVKHTFQRSNFSITQDLQLKTVYGSSIEYLSDRWDPLQSLNGHFPFRTLLRITFVRQYVLFSASI